MKAEPASTKCVRCNSTKLTTKAFSITLKNKHGDTVVVKFCKSCTEDFASRYLLLTESGNEHLKQIYATWRKR